MSATHVGVEAFERMLLLHGIKLYREWDTSLALSDLTSYPELLWFRQCNLQPRLLTAVSAINLKVAERYSFLKRFYWAGGMERSKID